MAAITDIVSVSISLETLTLAEDGFGIPMIADYHARFPERIRYYSKTTDMISDGFEVTDAAYKAASAILAQSPRVAEVAVGRRALAPDITVDLTPVAANSTEYVIYIGAADSDGADAVAEISFTSDASGTVAEICAGLAAAASAAFTAAGITNVNVTDNTTKVTVDADNAGEFFSVTVNKISLFAIAQVQSDPGIATDLAAIQAENPDWYGVVMTSNADAEIVAAADWVESNNKLFFAQSQNTNNITLSVNLSGVDVANELRAGSNLRTALLYHEDPMEMAAAAWIGRFFGRAPGKINAANKQLAGITISNLSATHITNLTAKNANFYVEYKGVGATRNGKVSGNEWIDFIRDRDWLKSRLETEIARAVLVTDKLPFTDAGINGIDAAVRAVLNEAANAGFLDGTSIVVNTPKASEVTSGNRAARILATIEWSARAQGAINHVDISGTVTV